MRILGISCHYHDASATLLIDGRIIGAAEEERFTRIKHDPSFPRNAIAWCLEEAGIGIEQIDYIAFYEKPLLKLERIMHTHLRAFPWSLKPFLSAMPSWMGHKSQVSKQIRGLGYRGDILFIEHHLAHAASAFLPSPFNQAAIVTVDGVGEWATTTIGIGSGRSIELRKQIDFPHSLGLFYSTMTAYLGFEVNDGEYKVMGLAAYGRQKDNPYLPKLRRVIDLQADGSFALDLSYFDFLHTDHMPSAKLCTLLGGPIRKEHEPILERHKHIAAATQAILEEALANLLAEAHAECGTDNLVLAGGVALNSLFNGKIISKTPFKRVWIQPNASDGGTSMGAALYAHHSLLSSPGRAPLRSPYLGPSFTDEQISAFLIGEGIIHTSLPPERIPQITARIIAQGNVVGWFQGGMEWGPRALGGRSILADPTNKDMQRILNERVKHRETFRPFAPAVCIEDAATYFDTDTPLPSPCEYMLMVYPVKRRWRARLPSITHADGTGRLQTVSRAMNPRYYDTIKAFGKISGVPILINTSFNIRGEPIVCTPQDAYRCMMGTQIDCLIMGAHLIWRKDNSKEY